MKKKMRLANGKVARLRKGVIMAYFKVLSQLLSGGSEDRVKNLSQNC